MSPFNDVNPTKSRVGYRHMNENDNGNSNHHNVSLEEKVEMLTKLTM